MTILLYLGFISQQSERIFEKILFFSSPFCNLNALYNVTENIYKKKETNYEWRNEKSCKTLDRR